MALWGALWGSLWGGLDPGPAFACDVSEARTLVQHPDAIGERQFRDWLCANSQQAGEYLDVLADVKAAFDVTTAVGVQLDMIGSTVGLPRSGQLDARYRTLLEIQIDLLIGSLPSNPNWTGTVNNLIGICRKFIGGAAPPAVVLQNAPPYSYLLTVPGVTTSELELLVRFLCQATWAAVLGQVIVLPAAGDNLWDSDHGAVAGSGIWCSDHGAVAGCALWSHVVVIGDDPC